MHVAVFMLRCAPGAACLAWCQLMKSLPTTAGVSVSFCSFIVSSLDVCTSCRLGISMAFLVSGSYSGKAFVKWLSPCLCPLLGWHTLFMTGAWWPHCESVALQPHHCTTLAPPCPLISHMIKWGPCLRGEGAHGLLQQGIL